MQLIQYLNKYNNISHENQYSFKTISLNGTIASLHLVYNIYYKMGANEIPLNVYINH